MSVVRVYSDESFCSKKSFRVISLLWGNPGYCELFNQEISDLVENNRSVLGPDFKEFHAINLSDQNWHVMSPIYDKILELLFTRIRAKNLGMFVVVISEDRFKNNAGWLTEIVRNAITDRASVFGKLFISLEQKDLPAVYYRVNQLFPIFKYREFFALPGDELEYYPDSTGKVLNYSNAQFAMSGTLPFSLSFKYFDIIRILGDSYLKSFSSVVEEFGWTGWPTSEQHLTIFKPTDSSSSYLIQTCDIVSNFLFNYIRHTVGLPDKKYELKSKAIERYMSLQNITPYIKASFTVDGTDVVCNDLDLWANINPII
jgi:hypothetical protein